MDSKHEEDVGKSTDTTDDIPNTTDDTKDKETDDVIDQPKGNTENDKSQIKIIEETTPANHVSENDNQTTSQEIFYEVSDEQHVYDSDVQTHDTSVCDEDNQLSDIKECTSSANDLTQISGLVSPIGEPRMKHDIESNCLDVVDGLPPSAAKSRSLSTLPSIEESNEEDLENAQFFQHTTPSTSYSLSSLPSSANSLFGHVVQGVSSKPTLTVIHEEIKGSSDEVLEQVGDDMTNGAENAEIGMIAPSKNIKISNCTLSEDATAHDIEVEPTINSKDGGLPFIKSNKGHGDAPMDDPFKDISSKMIEKQSYYPGGEGCLDLQDKTKIDFDLMPQPNIIVNVLIHEMIDNIPHHENVGEGEILDPAKFKTESEGDPNENPSVDQECDNAEGNNPDTLICPKTEDDIQKIKPEDSKTERQTTGDCVMEDSQTVELTTGDSDAHFTLMPSHGEYENIPQRTDNNAEDEKQTDTESKSPSLSESTAISGDEEIDTDEIKNAEQSPVHEYVMDPTRCSENGKSNDVKRVRLGEEVNEAKEIAPEDADDEKKPTYNKAKGSGSDSKVNDTMSSGCDVNSTRESHSEHTLSSANSDKQDKEGNEKDSQKQRDKDKDRDGNKRKRDRGAEEGSTQVELMGCLKNAVGDVCDKVSSNRSLSSGPYICEIMGSEPKTTCRLEWQLADVANDSQSGENQMDRRIQQISEISHNSSQDSDSISDSLKQNKPRSIQHHKSNQKKKHISMDVPTKSNDCHSPIPASHEAETDTLDICDSSNGADSSLSDDRVSSEASEHATQNGPFTSTQRMSLFHETENSTTMQEEPENDSEAQYIANFRGHVDTKQTSFDGKCPLGNEACSELDTENASVFETANTDLCSMFDQEHETFITANDMSTYDPRSTSRTISIRNETSASVESTHTDNDIGGSKRSENDDPLSQDTQREESTEKEEEENPESGVGLKIQADGGIGQMISDGDPLDIHEQGQSLSNVLDCVQQNTSLGNQPFTSITFQASVEPNKDSRKDKILEDDDQNVCGKGEKYICKDDDQNVFGKDKQNVFGEQNILRKGEQNATEGEHNVCAEGGQIDCGGKQDVCGGDVENVCAEEICVFQEGKKCISQDSEQGKGSGEHNACREVEPNDLINSQGHGERDVCQSACEDCQPHACGDDKNNDFGKVEEDTSGQGHDNACIAQMCEETVNGDYGESERGLGDKSLCVGNENEFNGEGKNDHQRDESEKYYRKGDTAECAEAEGNEHGMHVGQLCEEPECAGDVKGEVDGHRVPVESADGVCEDDVACLHWDKCGNDCENIGESNAFEKTGIHTNKIGEKSVRTDEVDEDVLENVHGEDDNNVFEGSEDYKLINDEDTKREISDEKVVCEVSECISRGENEHMIPGEDKVWRQSVKDEEHECVKHVEQESAVDGECWFDVCGENEHCLDVDKDSACEKDVDEDGECEKVSVGESQYMKCEIDKHKSEVIVNGTLIGNACDNVKNNVDSCEEIEVDVCTEGQKTGICGSDLDKKFEEVERHVKSNDGEGGEIGSVSPCEQEKSQYATCVDSEIHEDKAYRETKDRDCGNEYNVCAEIEDNICAEKEDNVCEGKEGNVCEEHEDKACAEHGNDVCAGTEDNVCAEKDGYVCEGNEHNICEGNSDNLCEGNKKNICVENEDNVCSENEDNVCSENEDNICKEQGDNLCSENKESVCADRADDVCAGNEDNACAEDKSEGNEGNILCSEHKDIECAEKEYHACGGNEDNACSEKVDDVCEENEDNVWTGKKDNVCAGKEGNVCEGKEDNVCTGTEDNACTGEDDHVFERKEGNALEGNEDSVCEGDEDNACAEKEDNICEGNEDHVHEEKKDNVCDGNDDNVCKGNEDNVCKGNEDNVCKGNEDNVCKGNEDNASIGSDDNDCEGNEDNECSEKVDSVCEENEDSAWAGKEDNICAGKDGNVCEGEEDNVCTVTEENACPGEEDHVFEGNKDNVCEGNEDNVCEGKEDNASEANEDSVCEGDEDNACAEKEDNVCEGNEEHVHGEKKDNLCEGNEDNVCKGNEDNASIRSEDNDCEENEDDAFEGNEDNACSKKVDNVCEENEDSAWAGEEDNICAGKEGNVCEGKEDKVCTRTEDNACPEEEDHALEGNKDNVCEANEDNVRKGIEDNASEGNEDSLCERDEDIVCEGKEYDACAEKEASVCDGKRENICEGNEDIACEGNEDNVCEGNEVNVCEGYEDNQCKGKQDNTCEEHGDNQCEGKEDNTCEEHEDNQCEGKQDNTCEEHEDCVCSGNEDIKCKEHKDNICEGNEDNACNRNEDNICEVNEDIEGCGSEDDMCTGDEGSECEEKKDNVCVLDEGNVCVENENTECSVDEKSACSKNEDNVCSGSKGNVCAGIEETQCVRNGENASAEHGDNMCARNEDNLTHDIICGENVEDDAPVQGGEDINDAAESIVCRDHEDNSCEEVKNRLGREDEDILCDKIGAAEQKKTFGLVSEKGSDNSFEGLDLGVWKKNEKDFCDNDKDGIDEEDEGNIGNELEDETNRNVEDEVSKDPIDNINEEACEKAEDGVFKEFDHDVRENAEDVMCKEPEHKANVETEDGAGKELNHNVHEDSEDAACKEFEDNVNEETEDGVCKEPDNNVHGDAEDGLCKVLEDDMKEETQDGVCKEFDDNEHRDVEDCRYNGLEGAVNGDAKAGTYEALKDNVNDEMEDGLKEYANVKPENDRCKALEDGTHEHEVYREVKDDLNRETEESGCKGLDDDVSGEVGDNVCKELEGGVNGDSEDDALQELEGNINGDAEDCVFNVLVDNVNGDAKDGTCKEVNCDVNVEAQDNVCEEPEALADVGNEEAERNLCEDFEDGEHRSAYIEYKEPIYDVRGDNVCQELEDDVSDFGRGNDSEKEENIASKTVQSNEENETVVGNDENICFIDVDRDRNLDKIEVDEMETESTSIMVICNRGEIVAHCEESESNDATEYRGTEKQDTDKLREKIENSLTCADVSDQLVCKEGDRDSGLSFMGEEGMEKLETNEIDIQKEINCSNERDQDHVVGDQREADGQQGNIEDVVMFGKGVDIEDEDKGNDEFDNEKGEELPELRLGNNLVDSLNCGQDIGNQTTKILPTEENIDNETEIEKEGAIHLQRKSQDDEVNMRNVDEVQFVEPNSTYHAEVQSESETPDAKRREDSEKLEITPCVENEEYVEMIDGVVTKSEKIESVRQTSELEFGTDEFNNKAVVNLDHDNEQSECFALQTAKTKPREGESWAEQIQEESNAKVLELRLVMNKTIVSGDVDDHLEMQKELEIGDNNEVIETGWGEHASIIEQMPPEDGKENNKLYMRIAAFEDRIREGQARNELITALQHVKIKDDDPVKLPLRTIHNEHGGGVLCSGIQKDTNPCEEMISKVKGPGGEKINTNANKEPLAGTSSKQIKITEQETDAQEINTHCPVAAESSGNEGPKLGTSETQNTDECEQNVKSGTEELSKETVAEDGYDFAKSMEEDETVRRLASSQEDVDQQCNGQGQARSTTGVAAIEVNNDVDKVFENNGHIVIPNEDKKDKELCDTSDIGLEMETVNAEKIGEGNFTHEFDLTESLDKRQVADDQTDDVIVQRGSVVEYGNGGIEENQDKTVVEHQKYKVETALPRYYSSFLITEAKSPGKEHNRDSTGAYEEDIEMEDVHGGLPLSFEPVENAYSKFQRSDCREEFNSYRPRAFDQDNWPAHSDYSKDCSHDDDIVSSDDPSKVDGKSSQDSSQSTLNQTIYEANHGSCQLAPDSQMVPDETDGIGGSCDNELEKEQAAATLSESGCGECLTDHILPAQQQQACLTDMEAAEVSETLAYCPVDSRLSDHSREQRGFADSGEWYTEISQEGVAEKTPNDENTDLPECQQPYVHTNGIELENKDEVTYEKHLIPNVIILDNKPVEKLNDVEDGTITLGNLISNRDECLVLPNHKNEENVMKSKRSDDDNDGEACTQSDTYLAANTRYDKHEERSSFALTEDVCHVLTSTKTECVPVIDIEAVGDLLDFKSDQTSDELTIKTPLLFSNIQDENVEPEASTVEAVKPLLDSHSTIEKMQMPGAARLGNKEDVAIKLFSSTTENVGVSESEGDKPVKQSETPFLPGDEKPEKILELIEEALSGHAGLADHEIDGEQYVHIDEERTSTHDSPETRDTLSKDEHDNFAKSAQTDTEIKMNDFDTSMKCELQERVLPSGSEGHPLADNVSQLPQPVLPSTTESGDLTYKDLEETKRQKKSKKDISPAKVDVDEVKKSDTPSSSKSKPLWRKVVARLQHPRSQKRSSAKLRKRPTSDDITTPTQPLVAEDSKENYDQEEMNDDGWKTLDRDSVPLKKRPSQNKTPGNKHDWRRFRRLRRMRHGAEMVPDKLPAMRRPSGSRMFHTTYSGPHTSYDNTNDMMAGPQERRADGKTRKKRSDLLLHRHVKEVELTSEQNTFSETDEVFEVYCDQDRREVSDLAESLANKGTPPVRLLMKPLMSGMHAQACQQNDKDSSMDIPVAAEPMRTRPSKRISCVVM